MQLFLIQKHLQTTSGNLERILSTDLIDPRKRFSLSGEKTICSLDYLLLQTCRWPVNGTSSGYYIITENRSRQKAEEVTVIIVEKGSSEIKKNKRKACILHWSRSSSLGLLLHTASEVAKGTRQIKTQGKRCREHLCSTGVLEMMGKKNRNTITWVSGGS